MWKESLDHCRQVLDSDPSGLATDHAIEEVLQHFLWNPESEEFGEYAGEVANEIQASFPLTPENDRLFMAGILEGICRLVRMNIAIAAHRPIQKAPYRPNPFFLGIAVQALITAILMTVISSRMNSAQQFLAGLLSFLVAFVLPWWKTRTSK